MRDLIGLRNKVKIFAVRPKSKPYDKNPSKFMKLAAVIARIVKVKTQIVLTRKVILFCKCRRPQKKVSGGFRSGPRCNADSARHPRVNAA